MPFSRITGNLRWFIRKPVLAPGRTEQDGVLVHQPPVLQQEVVIDLQTSETSWVDVPVCRELDS